MSILRNIFGVSCLPLPFSGPSAQLQKGLHFGREKKRRDSACLIRLCPFRPSSLPCGRIFPPSPPATSFSLTVRRGGGTNREGNFHRQRNSPCITLGEGVNWLERGVGPLRHQAEEQRRLVGNLKGTGSTQLLTRLGYKGKKASVKAFDCLPEVLGLNPVTVFTSATVCISAHGTMKEKRKLWAYCTKWAQNGFVCKLAQKGFASLLARWKLRANISFMYSNNVLIRSACCRCATSNCFPGLVFLQYLVLDEPTCCWYALS
eukprot:279327-Pelagomonas_calceolata.AAC.1